MQRSRLHRAIVLSAVIAALLFAALTSMAGADPVATETARAAIAWDDVGEATSYRVYTRAVDGGDPVLVAELQGSSCTIEIASGAGVVVGVQAVRRVTVLGKPDQGEAVSDIAWSEDPEVCDDGETFGFYHSRPQVLPVGLSVVYYLQE